MLVSYAAFLALSLAARAADTVKIELTDETKIPTALRAWVTWVDTGKLAVAEGIELTETTQGVVARKKKVKVRFNCTCPGAGDCEARPVNGSVNCTGDSCCFLLVEIPAAMADSGGR